MTADRNRKLAEMDDIAHGVRYGIAAFNDRLEEMGPGIGQRSTGRSGKGSVSRPVEDAAGVTDGRQPPRSVTSRLDRIIDAAHALMLDLDAAYGEIARTKHGLPAKGEPSCAWCAEAVQAAAKVEAKEGKSPIPLDYRSPTYLYAEVRKGDKVVGKQLVCEWCYRFNLRHERKPTIEERWIHAQGGQVHPGRANSVRMKAAARVRENVG
jgi:hypothetical protein